MKTRLFGALCIGIFSLGLSATVEASLVSTLGGQAVYDTDLDITWLADTNAGAGSAFDDGYNATDGRMSWDSAKAWAAGLTVGGFTNWRLPTTADPDASCTDDQAGNTPSLDALGWNCTGSEMGHLFYNELGGTAGSSILTSGDPDLTLFSFAPGPLYWSGREFAPIPPAAWTFNFADGVQRVDNSDSNIFAWAVHSGNIGGPVVPVPPTLYLFGSGLIGLVVMARRKKLRSR